MTNFINAQHWTSEYKRQWGIAINNNQWGKAYTLQRQVQYLRYLNPNLDLRLMSNKQEVTQQLERIKVATSQHISPMGKIRMRWNREIHANRI